MKPVYIFDLDGTLANIEHRKHHITGPVKNWPAFFAECISDTPILRTIQTMNALRSSGAEIWIWTGRSDEVKAQTVEWLCRNQCFGKSTGTLPAWPLAEAVRFQMRKQGDHRFDAVLKEEWLHALSEEDRSRIVAVFEDRGRVVQMWRSNGLTCFQVEEGDF